MLVQFLLQPGGPTAIRTCDACAEGYLSVRFFPSAVPVCYECHVLFYLLTNAAAACNFLHISHLLCL